MEATCKHELLVLKNHRTCYQQVDSTGTQVTFDLCSKPLQYIAPEVCNPMAGCGYGNTCDQTITLHLAPTEYVLSVDVSIGMEGYSATGPRVGYIQIKTTSNQIATVSGII